MQKSIRQSMAWLHAWSGLIFGWLLFVIFLMGSASYYRQEINTWMQPQFASMQINQHTAIEPANQYLQTHAADAKSWYIGVATPQTPVNQIYWQKADGSYQSKTLDASTGKELTLSATQGGDFFYTFHYQLFGIPVNIGRLLVTFAAFIMLIALVSGIITHKKIITDFFTLRAFKGQRSYLDFHNVTSVIAIPFFLTITFTGIAIFFYLYLPWGMNKLYPQQPFQYFEEISSVAEQQKPEPKPATMLPIQYFVAQTQALWGATTYSNISVKSPNTSNAKITLTELKDQSITRNQAQISFNAIDGTALGNTRNDSAIATLNAGVYGLHMATFAPSLLRLGFFFSGILGCLMIGSGLLLWSLKRQIQNKQQKFHFGHYLVNRLNVASLIGLPIAMLCYLYANRIFEIKPNQPNYEIYTFFTVWLLSFMVALCTQQAYLWKSMLKGFILLGLALPFFNLYTLLQQQYIHNFSEYWAFLRVDLMIVIFAVAAIFLHQRIQPIQIKATHKLQQKIVRSNPQEGS